MSRFLNVRSRGLTPYTAGEQPKEGDKLIKINTNESPYPPSQRVLEAIKENLDASLRLYPNPDATIARQAFATKYGLNQDQVFAGNGSDEILAFAFMAFFGDKDILMPDISYSFYMVYSNLIGASYKLLPLKEDYTIDYMAFEKEKGDVIFANPNAPTSIYLPIDKIERILKAHKDDLVLVDEAYIEFGGQSAIGLISKYDNLLIVRTLSKAYALAGLRVGFACGHKDLIYGLNMVKDSFNSYTLDRLAQIGAKVALEDDGYYDETISRIINTRERVKKELEDNAFKVLDSKANFLFISHESIKAKDMYEYLRDHKVLVRYFDTARIDNFIRVTIGTDEEMDLFLKYLKEMK